MEGAMKMHYMPPALQDYGAVSDITGVLNSPGGGDAVLLYPSESGTPDVISNNDDRGSQNICFLDSDGDGQAGTGESIQCP